MHEALDFYQVDPDRMHGEDPNECGGYFVITGAEKVLVAQERPRNNYAFVQRESDGSYRAECRSFNETKFRSTSTLYVQLHPQHATDDLIERRVTPVRISVRIPFVNDALALPTVMKLMHITEISDMLDHICTADDLPWLRDQVLAALMFDVDSALIDREPPSPGWRTSGPALCAVRPQAPLNAAAAATSAAAAPPRREAGRRRRSAAAPTRPPTATAPSGRSTRCSAASFCRTRATPRRHCRRRRRCSG